MNEDPMNPVPSAAPATPAMPAPEPASVNPAMSAAPAIDQPMMSPVEPAAPIQPMAAPVMPMAPAAPAMVPETPVMPAATAMPEVAAMPETPGVSATPAAPIAPEPPVTADAISAPTIDSSLLQQAINDVPDANGNLPPTPADSSVIPSADAAAPAPFTEEAPKATPSVAFNDPAQAPDAPKPFSPKKPSFLDGKKINPVILIVAGSAIIIIALVILIAFAM